MTLVATDFPEGTACFGMQTGVDQKLAGELLAGRARYFLQRLSSNSPLSYAKFPPPEAQEEQQHNGIMNDSTVRPSLSTDMELNDSLAWRLEYLTAEVDQFQSIVNRLYPLLMGDQQELRVVLDQVWSSHRNLMLRAAKRDEPSRRGGHVSKNTTVRIKASKPPKETKSNKFDWKHTVELPLMPFSMNPLDVMALFIVGLIAVIPYLDAIFGCYKPSL